MGVATTIDPKIGIGLLAAALALLFATKGWLLATATAFSFATSGWLLATAESLRSSPWDFRDEILKWIGPVPEADGFAGIAKEDVADDEAEGFGSFGMLAFLVVFAKGLRFFLSRKASKS